MAAALRKFCPELKDLKAFGTDGDPALYKPFQEMFPDADHLLCDIHMRDNVVKQLRKLGERPTNVVEVVADIFGEKEGNQKTAGLVDFTEEGFEAERDKLYAKWEAGLDEGAKFVQYFRENKEQLIRNCMLLTNRVACHINLDIYTQNANECMNSVIRKETGMKKLKLSPFVAAMKKLVDDQEHRIEGTLINKTEGMELLPQYSHLTVKQTDFYRM